VNYQTKNTDFLIGAKKQYEKFRKMLQDNRFDMSQINRLRDFRKKLGLYLDSVLFRENFAVIKSNLVLD
jgi:hypothetical protein